MRRPAQAKIVGRSRAGYDESFIHIVQGEYHVTDDPNVLLTTILGSCVAACIRDPLAGIGGMNHFLLPAGDRRAGGGSLRFGVHAMELLINDILRRRGVDTVSYRRGMDEDTRRIPDLKTADIVIIRKAWDVGTEVVIMQSTIQIDGDVVTRVLKGRDTAANSTMIGVHRDAVDVSFRYWSFMVEALGRFAGKAVNTLVGDTG